MPPRTFLMKRLGIVLGVLVVLILVLVMARNGPGDNSSVKKKEFISIGTGGTGGVYYPYGGGLAQIWTQHVPGIKAVAEVTAASVENVKLVHKGETVIAEIMGDVAYQAYHGEGRFAGSPQKVMAMAVMYPNILHVVALKNAKVNRFSEIKGNTVSTGAPGSGTEFMCNLMFEALNIDQDSFKVRRLSFVENANAMKDRTIDVGIWCVAPPTSSIMDLATTHGIKIIPFSLAEQNAVIDRYPFYSAAELPAGVYNGVETAVPTMSVWNVIICQSDLSPDRVYDLVKALFENVDYLKKVHPFARFTTPENAVKHSPIPLHPGAQMYFKEQGLSVDVKLESATTDPNTT